MAPAGVAPLAFAFPVVTHPAGGEEATAPAVAHYTSATPWAAGVMAMTRNLVWLTATTAFAASATDALFRWEREYVGFILMSATIRIDRPHEFRAGHHEWDRAVGLFPYEYQRKWERFTGGVSRWEVVRFDRTNYRLSLAIAAAAWGLVGVAACRCVRPWTTQPAEYRGG